MAGKDNQNSVFIHQTSNDQVQTGCCQSGRSERELPAQDQAGIRNDGWWRRTMLWFFLLMVRGVAVIQHGSIALRWAERSRVLISTHYCPFQLGNALRQALMAPFTCLSRTYPPRLQCPLGKMPLSSSKCFELINKDPAHYISPEESSAHINCFYLELKGIAFPPYFFPLRNSRIFSQFVYFNTFFYNFLFQSPSSNCASWSICWWAQEC